MNKFFKIYLELREKIEHRQYRSNSLLPSENELAREYNVSRETIRKALLLLLENGYIHKIQGKGSIVLDVHRYRLPVTGLLSFKERRQFQDVEATTKVIVNEEDTTYIDLNGHKHIAVLRSDVYTEGTDFLHYTESRHRVDKFYFSEFARRKSDKIN